MKNSEATFQPLVMLKFFHANKCNTHVSAEESKAMNLKLSFTPLLRIFRGDLRGQNVLGIGY